MTAKFNDSGARGLLLNTLNLNTNLDIVLESKSRNESNSNYLNKQNEDLDHNKLNEEMLELISSKKINLF
jgi:hypothetical protein